MNKMDNYATKVVEENELQIKLLKTFGFKSYNIGYLYTKIVGHLSRDDMIKVVVKSKNKEDKFAVAIVKGNCLVGYI